MISILPLYSTEPGVDNCMCIRWMVSCDPDDSKTIVIGKAVVEPVPYADHYVSVDPLKACTGYTCYVSGVSPSGSQGSTESTYTTTNEVRKYKSCICLYGSEVLSKFLMQVSVIYEADPIFKINFSSL